MLEKAATKVIDSSKTAIGRWPGRTIPFAVDERVKAIKGLHEAVTNAARMVNNYSNVQLVECPLNVAESTDELEGYIYVSTSKAWCTGKCCATDLGYKPKVLWEGFLTYFRGG
ncbi:MAG: hypothetical protein EOS75_30060 [Mesorhizobium sp.]|nr:MAG: hypothetical protein EOS74_10745 [Mesorhizobium sp.]RWD52222.1 MAG: hypothetical protein EOS75_30060 [Mesorhizobium sp.]